MSNEIDIDLLKLIFDIDGDAGQLYWRERPSYMFKNAHVARSWNTRRAGTRAGSIDAHGYVQICFYGRYLKGHRIIFAMIHGIYPEQIDHIDGNRSNNVPSNLRASSNLENHRNVGISHRNSSGHLGVSLNKTSGKYVAYIHNKGKHVHLGTFSSLHEAAAAREKANKDYGYDENHGQRQSTRDKYKSKRITIR